MKILFEKGNVLDNGFLVGYENNHIFFKGSFNLTKDDEVYNVFEFIEKLDRNNDVYIDLTELDYMNSSALKYFCQLIIDYSYIKNNYKGKLYIQNFKNNTLKNYMFKNFNTVKEKSGADNVILNLN